MSAIDNMIANAAAAAQNQTANTAQTQGPVVIEHTVQETHSSQTVQNTAVMDEEAALLAQLAAVKAKKEQSQAAVNASAQSTTAYQQIQPQYLPANNQPVAQPQPNMAVGAVGASALPAHLAAGLAQPMDMSMETFMSMGMAVDLWLKPSFAGLTIGENATPVPHVDVVIDMTEKLGFTLVMAIRFGKEPNVKYDYTTDCVTNKDGRPWADALAQAYAADPSVSPYRAVQLPMVVLEETKNFQNQVVALAGQTLGYTTAVTGWSSWQNFYLQVQRAGLLNNKVRARLTNEAKVKDTNRWGLVKFELLGAAATTATNTEQKTA